MCVRTAVRSGDAKEGGASVVSFALRALEPDADPKLARAEPKPARGDVKRRLFFFAYRRRKKLSRGGGFVVVPHLRVAADGDVEDDRVDDGG